MRPARTGTLTTWGLTSNRGETWQDQAACRNPNFDPNLWTSPLAEDRGQARWVCENLCDVLGACKRWARNNTELCDQAVYGGVYFNRRSDRHTGQRLGPVRVATQQPVARYPTGRPAHQDHERPRPSKPRVQLMPHLQEILALREAGHTYRAIAERYDGASTDAIKDLIYRWRSRASDEDAA